MEDYIKLANVIFPNITKTIDDLEKEYPSRNLPSNAEVTRFAPSPTGFLHTGSLFTVLVAKKVADQSKGVFYTRLEDTDTKREVEGSGEELLEQLKIFNVAPNEGYLGNHEEGIYGPYKQSLRADIYKVVIKDLLMRGRAYPCFCSQDELKTLRDEQEKNKVIPGYYGKYAKCRNLTVDEAIPLVDKYLDDCFMAKISPVRIVHGKGTGALRNGIHKYLKTNKYVDSFRLGTFGEGEMGVTVVNLKI